MMLCAVTDDRTCAPDKTINFLGPRVSPVEGLFAFLALIGSVTGCDSVRR